MTGSEPAKDSETAALLSGLGRAEVATVTRERIPGAVVSLSRAFDYYAEAGDVARAVGVIEYQVPAYPGHRTGMGQLIGRALDLVAPDSHQAGYLLSLYGRVLGWEEAEYLGAEEAFSKALAIARREGDEILEMRTLAAATVVNFMQIRWQEAVEKGLQAIELSRRVDDPSAESTARYWTSVTLATKGEVEGARLHSTANQTLAERLRDRVSVAHAFWPSEIVSYLEGDWRAAREFSDKGLAVLPMDPRLLMNRVPLEYQVGDFGQGEAHLERLLEAINLTPPGPTPAYSNPAMVIPLVARITGVADRFELAEEAAATVLSSPSVTPLLTMITRVGLAMMAVQRGEVAAAAEQYTALEPLRGTAMVSIMAADRLLGLLSHTMGNLDQGVGHFEEGLLFCRKAGYRPELAWTCCDYADILLQRNEPGDREKAMALLEESLAISSELGMRPLMERVLSRREILGA